MLKIKKVAAFDQSSNKMKIIADVEKAIKEFKSKRNKNLDFLLNNRFSWMKKFIRPEDKGLEVGAGTGFSKNYIKNKNFVISDLAMHSHLDLKNIDAQQTNLDPESYDFVIAVNMLHHVPYPLKFLNEMYKILKPEGKLIIQEAHPSVLLQLIVIFMRHEGFDFTKDVWSEKIAMSKEDDVWSGNIAVSHLIFDNKKKFDEKFIKKFRIIHQKFFECFIFLNSGGVTSKTFYLPMNYFFLNILNAFDNIITKLFPNFFAMGRQIVLQKI